MFLKLKSSSFSATEKSLKQESVLQEEINSPQGTDVETPDHELEDAKPEAQSVLRATQVEDSLLHYMSFINLSYGV